MSGSDILTVLISGRTAGTLDLSGEHPWFRYDPAYRRSGTAALSVMFPLTSTGASGEPLHCWLEGILPDHPDAISALCAEQGIADADALRLLATPMGADCAGREHDPEYQRGSADGAYRSIRTRPH